MPTRNRPKIELWLMKVLEEVYSAFGAGCCRREEGESCMKH